LLYEDINLLILDEPTNHLDIDSIETLEEALEDFKGTIFFISHDRYFINRISQRIIAIEDNTFKTYLGNYDYYKLKKDELNLDTEELPTVSKEKVKKPRNIDEAQKTQAEAVKVEGIIEALENSIKEIEGAMAAAKLDYKELNELYCRKNDLSKELDSAMKLWLSLAN
jgi:ATPase subunit of ABC transporter with duplicated ATPase domains